MNSFRCPNCGFLNFASAQSCKRCKTEFAQGAADLAVKTVDSRSHNDSSAGSSLNKFASINPAAFENSQNVDSAEFTEQDLNQQQNQENYSARAAHRQNFDSAANSFSATSFDSRQINSNLSDKDKKTGMATASLVLGIIGFFSAGLLGVGALVGVILGVTALRRASKKPNEYGGKGLSIAGILLNCLSVFSIFFIGIIAAIAIPNLLAARRAANEGAAISSMRTLLSAESVYMSTNTTNRCGDLTDLLGSRLIDKTLASGEKSGYKYVIIKSANGSCELLAQPLVSNGVGETGIRSFYASTNEGEIRAADKNGAPAGKNDPALRLMDNSTQPERNRPGSNDY